MKIEIEKLEDGFKVTCGDRYESPLTPDEALGCIARFIYAPNEPIPYLRTQAQHEAFEAMLAENRRKIRAALARRDTEADTIVHDTEL